MILFVHYILPFSPLCDAVWPRLGAHKRVCYLTVRNEDVHHGGLYESYFFFLHLASPSFRMLVGSRMMDDVGGLSAPALAAEWHT